MFDEESLIERAMPIEQICHGSEVSCPKEITSVINHLVLHQTLYGLVKTNVDSFVYL